MKTDASSSGDSGYSQIHLEFFVEVQTAAEGVLRLLHEHQEISGSSGSARYAETIATTIVDLCHHGQKVKAEDAIEIAEMIPKLLRALWAEIDVVLERKQAGAC